MFLDHFDALVLKKYYFNTFPTTLPNRLTKTLKEMIKKGKKIKVKKKQKNWLYFSYDLLFFYKFYRQINYQFIFLYFIFF